ncbi:TonB-dependent receptor [Caulobacter sp. S45]|uniref:TonB-dependent receptor n=1 Tax=Caulobacter sp. S45 TaxID=1641861 RepID=UPI00131E6D73|nr:TonB-dependent receptor [Caulobacter sp. S45]
MKNYLFGTSALLLTAWASIACAQTTQDTPARFGAPASGASANAPSANVPAAAGPSVGLQEIVVTAQRRSENVQKAPIAIDTVTGSALAAHNVTDVTGLTQVVPSVQIGQAAGPYPVFFVRGAGSFATNSLSDSAVSLSIDGVPIARQYGVNGQFFDLARVEVLEGPQGTLYGRNATAGAINFIPQKPNQVFSADAGVSYGNYNAVTANAAVNLPINDDLAVRAAFQTTSHSGYETEGLGDDDTQSGRIEALYRPTSTLSILLSGDMVKQGGQGSGFALVNGTGYSPSQRISLEDPRAAALLTSKGLEPFPTGYAFQDNRYGGLKAEINWTTDYGTFTVLPAYRNDHIFFNTPYGSSEKDDETNNQESVEARFASKDTGFLRYIVGVYYLHDIADANEQIDNRNGLGNQQNYSSGTDSKAVFTDINLHPTSQFTILGGIRYTDETKTLNGTLYNPFIASPPIIRDNDSATADKLTWRVGGQYDITPSSMVYGTVATSFRSGGFYFTADNGAFQPEDVIAYTLGTKNRFFDNKLQLNFEVFGWDYSNQQLSYSTFDSKNNQIFATVNAGSTKEHGAELDTKYRLTPTTQLGVDVQYLHARFQQFEYVQAGAPTPGTLCQTATVPGGHQINCAGLTPPNSPTWVVSPTLIQTFNLGNGGSVEFNGTGHYQTASFTAVQLVPASDLQPSYFTGDLSLTYNEPQGKWKIGLFVNNVANSTIQQYTVHGAINTAILSPPRTFGVRASLHYQ